MSQMPSYSPPVAPAQKTASNSIGTAGLVLGILSSATCWMTFVWFVPASTGIVGLVLSILGLLKSKKVGAGRGGSIAGLVCSIVGIVFTAVILVYWILTAMWAQELWMKAKGGDTTTL